MKIENLNILRGLSLTPKMLMLTVLVGCLVWAGLDYVQTKKLRSMFEKDLTMKLNRQAQEDRIRFDNYVAAYNQTAELIVSQKSFYDYVNDKARFPDWSRKVKPHTELPPWMPDASVMRKFVPIHYAFLLDDRGRLRELWQGLPEPPPESLLNPSDLVRKLSHNQSFMTTVNGAPFLLTAESIAGRGATLMIAARINDDFLAASQGLTSNDRMVALVSAEGPRIVACNRPEMMHSGIPLKELRGKYLITGKSFFDWGASDLELQFTSFMPRDEFEGLSKSILLTERVQRALVSFLLILAFALIMLGITKRIKRLTRVISDYSQNALQKHSAGIQKGDDIYILQTHFEEFAKEIIESREKLRKQADEALADVKVLSGLLPICASCKKIRDDKGYWSQMETYISRHSEALFSHGICPECAEKLYPEYYMKIRRGEEGQ